MKWKIVLALYGVVFAGASTKRGVPEPATTKSGSSKRMNRNPDFDAELERVLTTPPQSRRPSLPSTSRPRTSKTAEVVSPPRTSSRKATVEVHSSKTTDAGALKNPDSLKTQQLKKADSFRTDSLKKTDTKSKTNGSKPAETTLKEESKGIFASMFGAAGSYGLSILSPWAKKNSEEAAAKAKADKEKLDREIAAGVCDPSSSIFPCSLRMFGRTLRGMGNAAKANALGSVHEKALDKKEELDFKEKERVKANDERRKERRSSMGFAPNFGALN